MMLRGIALRVSTVKKKIIRVLFHVLFLELIHL